MAPTVRYHNRVIFGATSGGTGNFVVSAAVVGYRTPATAGVTDESVVSYTAETSDKTQWETGQGTYDVATTTLRRDTVRENSSGTTALINFSSAPIVQLDLHAQDLTPDMWVDVRDFVDYAGFGQGFTDDGPAIQAAINYAYSNEKTTVVIPDGSYCTIKEPIWLAPPGSYAAVDPQTGGSFTVFQFSLALVGGEALGDGLYVGVTIEGYGESGGSIDYNNGFPDYPIIIVGPGQGMRVAGINVRGGAGSLFTTTFPTTGVGIAISGGAGGASRTVIERCWAEKLYTGFKTGWNEDSLADSNTFIKCTANDCHIGYHIRQTQNYINELYSCNSHCPTGVLSDVGKPVHVFGGNFSYGNAIKVDFDISGTTGFTVTGSGTSVAFTTTITFDPGDLSGFAENGFTDGGVSNPIYTCFAIETESFGIIPLSYSTYNAATNAVTLFFETGWWTYHFGINPPVDITTTDLEAEVQACTQLLAAQRVTHFKGTGIHAFGPHFESPGSVTCFLDCDSGFQGARLSTLDNMYLNYAPTVDAVAMVLKLQSVWPIIDAQNGSFSLKGGQLNLSQGRQTPPWVFKLNDLSDFWVENCPIASPNIWNPGGGAPEINQTVYNTTTRGTGHWDATPFFPTQGSVSWVGLDGLGIGWTQLNRGTYPALGNVPAPGATPEITPAFYALMAASPIVAAVGTYPPICGRQMYRVFNWDAGDDGAGNAFVKSDHDMFSYGQDLTITWSYKGFSNSVYVDDIGWLFPGLKIGLDQGGITWYKILGVYPDPGDYTNPRPGYVTVYRVSGGSIGNWPLTIGTKTVTYTDTVIHQEAYSFTTHGGPTTGAVLVGALPAASAALNGARRVVTDATVTTFASVVAGTGANTVPVYCDGTNWRIG